MGRSAWGLAGAAALTFALLGACAGDGPAAPPPGAGGAGVGDDAAPGDVISEGAEDGSADAPPGTFVPIGHHDLGARGMNAALAVVGDHVYIGSRTEGRGVLIVNTSDPRAPFVVGEIGPPHEGLSGMTSRELRALPDKKQLFVLNFACSTQIHACTLDPVLYPDTGGAAERDNLKIYDVSVPTAPALIGTFDFGTYPGNDATKPHEFFLWRDPDQADRVLLFVTTPVGPPSLQVLGGRPSNRPPAANELTSSPFCDLAAPPRPVPLESRLPRAC